MVVTISMAIRWTIRVTVGVSIVRAVVTGIFRCRCGSIPGRLGSPLGFAPVIVRPSTIVTIVACLSLGRH